MAIAEKITSYTAWVAQTNYLSHTRTIRLSLESGTSVYIGFPETLPTNWLTFGNGSITMYLQAEEYDHVYHLLQTEKPVFCTALDLFDLQVGVMAGATRKPAHHATQVVARLACTRRRGPSAPENRGRSQAWAAPRSRLPTVAFGPMSSTSAASSSP